MKKPSGKIESIEEERPEVKVGFRFRDLNAEKFLAVKASVETRIGKVHITDLVMELMGFVFPPKKISQLERDIISGKVSIPKRHGTILTDPRSNKGKTADN